MNLLLTERSGVAGANAEMHWADRESTGRKPGGN
jgi:hypothetical protein